MILSKDADEIVELFEDLGFERTHTKDDLYGHKDIVSVRMKDSNGFHVDIVHSDKITQDMVSIRMNVDNFDEARKLLEKHTVLISGIVWFFRRSKTALRLSAYELTIASSRHTWIQLSIKNYSFFCLLRIKNTIYAPIATPIVFKIKSSTSVCLPRQKS